MLQRSLRNARNSGLPLRVSLRAEDAALSGELAGQGIDCLLCRRAREGMGATLAESVAALPAEWHAVMIALADMPAVRPDTYLAVARAAGGGAIALPEYLGRRGHPVLFPAELFGALCRLSGDRGASGLLKQHVQRLRPVTVSDPGVLLDVDVPADLEAVGHAQS